MSNDDTNLENTLAMCKRFGFNAEITNEIVWNTAYKLGRSRWHWGPFWFVNVIGWINTQRSRLRQLLPILIAFACAGCASSQAPDMRDVLYPPEPSVYSSMAKALRAETAPLAPVVPKPLDKSAPFVYPPVDPCAYIWSVEEATNLAGPWHIVETYTLSCPPSGYYRMTNTNAAIFLRLKGTLK